MPLNPVDGIEQVERVGGDIACVIDAEAVERCGPGRHVVRTNEHRFAANTPRAESRARPIRGADVERHADNGDVEITRVGVTRQPHEGGDATEAGHVVSAEWLGVTR